MAKSLLAILVILASIVVATNGEKILIFLGMASHSHRVAIQPLANALSERGHDLTFFSPMKPEVPDPKIQEYCPQALIDANEQMAEDVTTAAALRRLEDRYFDPFTDGNNFWDLLIQIQFAILKSPGFSEWFKDSNFDLIIYDHPGKEFIYAMALKMKAKVIAFVPAMAPVAFDEQYFGFLVESWAESVINNKYWFIPDRYFHSLTTISWTSSYGEYYLPKAEALSREALGFDFPPFEQILKNVDLILMNDHFSAGYPKAYPPLVVPVGGMHAKESNGTLPEDLEHFLDNVDRFVYFSFGSIVRVSKLPLKFRTVLFKAVDSIPGTKFLWKWEGDVPEDLPNNALAMNWFPQQDVLAHPKCKGFVTQGGAMSLQQSIFHGVPVLVVPGFADQDYNARMVASLGIGLYMEMADITVESFSGAILQLLENDSYASNMKEAARRFKDRPLSALETAVWWTEYVLRHDTAHLKSGAMEQTWWQKRSLDLWLVLFLIASIHLILTTLCLWKCTKFAFGKSEWKKFKQP